MGFYRKSFEVVGYTYEADTHCVRCTVRAFGADERGEVFAQDREGNNVHPIFLDQAVPGITCGTCGEPID